MERELSFANYIELQIAKRCSLNFREVFKWEYGETQRKGEYCRENGITINALLPSVER